MPHSKFSKFFIIICILALGFVFYTFMFSDRPVFEGNFSNNNKKITLVDDGMEYELTAAAGNTVADVLEEKGISIGEHDYVFPSKESKVYENSNIIIQREKNVSFLVDGKKVPVATTGKTVALALWDAGVQLGEDDFTVPSSETPIRDKNTIEVVRVDIREETVKKEIDFEQKITEDEDLGWRIKKVSQKGEKGIDAYVYKVVSHNGKEISRKLLSKERTKDPVPEISVQGTYMKLGKGKTGQGTWYAFKGGLFAASTTIPRGGYAKVTNTENGKTVVVQINDYGPQGKGRIIDLDKVAFEKIASLGAGVVGVKVEQILN